MLHIGELSRVWCKTFTCGFWSRLNWTMVHGVWCTKPRKKFVNDISVVTIAISMYFERCRCISTHFLWTIRSISLCRRLNRPLGIRASRIIISFINRRRQQLGLSSQNGMTIKLNDKTAQWSPLLALVMAFFLLFWSVDYWSNFAELSMADGNWNGRAHNSRSNTQCTNAIADAMRLLPHECIRFVNRLRRQTFFFVVELRQFYHSKCGWCRLCGDVSPNAVLQNRETDEDKYEIVNRSPTQTILYR